MALENFGPATQWKISRSSMIPFIFHSKTCPSAIRLTSRPWRMLLVFQFHDCSHELWRQCHDIMNDWVFLWSKNRRVRNNTGCRKYSESYVSNLWCIQRCLVRLVRSYVGVRGALALVLVSGFSLVSWYFGKASGSGCVLKLLRTFPWRVSTSMDIFKPEYAWKTTTSQNLTRFRIIAMLLLMPCTCGTSESCLQWISREVLEIKCDMDYVKLDLNTPNSLILNMGCFSCGPSFWETHQWFIPHVEPHTYWTYWFNYWWTTWQSRKRSNSPKLQASFEIIWNYDQETNLLRFIEFQSFPEQSLRLVSSHSSSHLCWCEPQRWLPLLVARRSDKRV